MKLMLPLVSRPHHFTESRPSMPWARVCSATALMFNRSERRFSSRLSVLDEDDKRGELASADDPQQKDDEDVGDGSAKDDVHRHS